MYVYMLTSTMHNPYRKNAKILLNQPNREMMLRSHFHIPVGIALLPSYLLLKFIITYFYQKWTLNHMLPSHAAWIRMTVFIYSAYRVKNQIF